MITLLLALASAMACEPTDMPPDRLQVAWVSPLDKQVGASAWLEVVRVADLRAWIHEQGTEPLRLLQGMGMVKRKAEVDTRYKITLFDVQRDWLCRPMSDVDAGDDVGGVSACEGPKPLRRHKPGFTGCGYTLDTADSTRGLDVFRVQWEVASAWGFCVMPLERFLSGA